ncbi:MAG: PQQ-like beta-propeller repeat protein [Gemmataceae bacterium]|nr:PQQ-like beta-propeller repeat protein [Gemmataceae bacterium]
MLGIAFLLTLWFVGCSRARWRTRLTVLAVVLVLAASVPLLLRVEGFTGDLFPLLTWRWKPVEDFTLPEPTPITRAQGTTPVDLKTTSANDYPEFLGPQRRGTLTGLGLARAWSVQPPRLLWRQPIGAGWSAFAIVGSHAVTQEQRGEQEMVVCYDLRTGGVQWTHQDPVRFSEAMGGDGPRSTPTILGGRVYTVGATGLLNCLDGATGQRIWSCDILADNDSKNLQWAKSCSPLVVDNLVVVSLGEGPPHCLAAYDKETGKRVWRAGHDKASYSSPVLTTLAGRRQIVVVNATSVTGHNPADGQLLWEHPWPGEYPKVSQPVPVAGDRVFVSAGYGVGAALLQVKAGAGDQLEVAAIWSNRHMKTRFTNVVVHDGFVYGLDDGILECLELATGARKWKDGRYGHGQILLVDDLLLVQAESGDLILVEANPTGLRELSRYPALNSKTWNNPALSGRYLLVRNDREAACYQLPIRQSGQEVKSEQEPGF